MEALAQGCAWVPATIPTARGDGPLTPTSKGAASWARPEPASAPPRLECSLCLPTREGFLHMINLAFWKALCISKFFLPLAVLREKGF